jgi:ketosteroid isomerase-like protein
MRAAVPPLVVLAALACSAPAKGPGQVALPPEMVAPDPGPDALLADLRATVLESYEARSGGYEEAYLDSVSHDAKLILISVGPQDVVLGYDPIACQRNRPFRDRPAVFISKALDVQLALDRSVAWVYDEISYRILHGAKQAIIPLRVTSVWERRTGRWIMTQEHVSYGVTDDDALSDAAAGRAHTPKPLGNTTAAGAEPVRAVLLRLISDEDDARKRHIAVGLGSVFVASDSDRERRGDKVAETTIRSMFGYDWEVRSSDLRVQLSASGTVAWAAGNVVVEGTGDDHRALPLRATWVLERRDDTWKVVQTHVSVPVSSTELQRRVLGEASAFR